MIPMISCQFSDRKYGRLTALLQANKQTALANGYDEALVSLTLLDADEDPVANCQLIIQAAPESALRQTRLTTNDAGQATSVLTSARPQTVRVWLAACPEKTIAIVFQAPQTGTQDASPDQKRPSSVDDYIGPTDTRMPIWRTIWFWLVERWPGLRRWSGWALENTLAAALIGILVVAIGIIAIATRRPQPEWLIIEQIGPVKPGADGFIVAPLRITSPLLPQSGTDISSTSTTTDYDLSLTYTLAPENGQPDPGNSVPTNPELAGRLDTEMLLPAKLIGQAVIITARLSESQDSVRVPLMPLPIAEIDRPSSANDIVYLAPEGVVVIQVDGRIFPPTAANWLFTVRDPATDVILLEQNCQTVQGECQLKLETNLTCLAYDIKLTSQIGASVVSAAQQIIACRDS
jgi:hypothetical protein